MFFQVKSEAAIPSAAGVELGGNGTFLFSDRSIQAFGLGAGYQGSVFYSMWNDRPIGAKLRIEMVEFREEAAQKSATDYLLANSSLKSMTQKWTLLGVGAEGRFKGQGQVLFWEALIGYALGADSPITVASAQPDLPPTSLSHTTRTAFFLSGGVGMKRVFNPKLTGLISLRTALFFQTPYSSSGLEEKSYFVFPVMFNVGIEVPFNWL
jgi:hypothetical protein